MMLNQCDPVRLDSGLDTVFHLHQVELEAVKAVRLLVYPRGHCIERVTCGRLPVITRHLCAVPLLLSVDQRVAVAKYNSIPVLDEGRYEGLLQVFMHSGWLDVGDVILLEIGDVELL